MWFFPAMGSLSRCYRECQRSKGVFSYENFESWGPSMPVAIFAGFITAYVWVRVKPLVTEHPDERQITDSQDFKEVRAFFKWLYDHVAEIWYASPWPFTKRSTPEGKRNRENEHTVLEAERMSKEGEDLLLSKGITDGATKPLSTETVLGTVAFKKHIAKDDVDKLKQKLNDMSNGPVHHVVESSTLLQTRLPITADLLTEAMELAKDGIEFDKQCTLQLGSWGIILQRENKVELLKFQGGHVPVLLGATREAEQELRVEGLFLEGVQMWAATVDKSVPLTNKSLIKGGFAHDQGAGWMDVLFVIEPPKFDDASMLYAMKSVEFEGRSLSLRSGFIPTGPRQRKLRNMETSSVYFLAAIVVVIVMLPKSFWWPIFGKVLLPLLQLVAMAAGWVLCRYLLLGEWPVERKEEPLMEMGNLRWSDDSIETPVDSGLKIEGGGLRKPPSQRLEKQLNDSKHRLAGAAICRVSCRVLEEGLEDMDRAVELDPHNDLPLRIRGCIKGLSLDYQGAIMDLNSALELRKDSSIFPAFVERGVFKFLRGDYDGAFVDFNEAIHQGPEQLSEVSRLRNSVKKILEDKEELVKLRAQIGELQFESAELRLASRKVQEDVSQETEVAEHLPPFQRVDLQYNSLCCERCIAKVKGALINMPGVESISVDMYTNRVSVTGYAPSLKLLEVATRISPTKMITLLPQAAEIRSDPEPEPRPMLPYATQGIPQESPKNLEF